MNPKKSLAIALSRLSFLSCGQKCELFNNLDNLSNLALLSIEDLKKLSGKNLSLDSWKPELLVKQVERDLEIVEKIGVKYHVCHVSAKESVEAIRKAKARGVDVTAETGPHYIAYNDMMLKESGNFKMNPPIRAEQDRLALIEGIKDGAIDMIATDHAPHSKEEKSKGLLSLNGVVGLETAFPVIYTKLVKTGEISLEKAIQIMSENPAKRFNLDIEIAEGKDANLCVYDLNKEYVVNAQDFISMGKSSPFDGVKLSGKCLMNIHMGKLVYNKLEK